MFKPKTHAITNDYQITQDALRIGNGKVVKCIQKSSNKEYVQKMLNNTPK